MKEWGDPLFCIVGTSRQGSPPGTERNGESMATTKAKAGGAPSGGTAAVVAGMAGPVAEELGLMLWDVRFVKEGSSIFLDGGTTMLELAKIIPDMYINVTTNGPNIALEIAEKMRPAVTLCGGVLNHKNLSLFGYSALDMISRLNVDVAFISASGYSEEGGFTCGYEEQAKLRRLLIEEARCVIILMDSTKFGKMLPYTFAKMEDVNYLITDQTSSPMLLADAERNNVTVL